MDPDPLLFNHEIGSNFRKRRGLKISSFDIKKENKKMILYLFSFLNHMFLNGHKNGQIGSGSGSIINWPPGSVRNIYGSRT
jgi:hypothetical protein